MNENNNNDNNKLNISLNELNERLNKIKRGPNYEISKEITNEELLKRLKELKNLPLKDITDEELLQKLNEIHPDSVLFESNNNKDSNKDNNINEIKVQDLDNLNLINNNTNNNIGINNNNDNYHNDIENNNIDTNDDDFESFLAEAGISEKVISRVTKELNNYNNEKNIDTSSSIKISNDANITKLEGKLNKTDDFTSHFLSEDDFSNEPELANVINQAKDELRLLPSNNYNISSTYNDSISISELQDVFDSDIFNENHEIQRIVSEAEDYARLQKKYGSNHSTPSATINTNTKKNQNSNQKKNISLTSFGVDSDRSYYYSIQAQDKYNETRHKSKKKSRRQGYNSDDDDDDDDDSVSSNNSY